MFGEAVALYGLCCLVGTALFLYRGWVRGRP